MGRAKPKGTTTNAAANHQYNFYALAGGLRIPMAIDGICSCDADASLVATTLATASIGVEVHRDGKLIYAAKSRTNAYSGWIVGRA